MVDIVCTYDASEARRRRDPACGSGPADGGLLRAADTCLPRHPGRVRLRPNTVTLIADRLGITTQAVSKICAVLYAEGLIDREPHVDDGRIRRLALTAEGCRVRDLMQNAGAEAERIWADLVGKETLDTVRRALTTYVAIPEPVSMLAPVRIRFS
jgi:DNA-binding MarR family transcriptional regulator